MQKQPIPRAVAKGELARLNEVLPVPYLLIGGLAVQHYHVARATQDIDLICDADTISKVLSELYPSHEWHLTDINEDDVRPSYRIRHRYKELGEIIFGPKLRERGAYPFLDWDDLALGAVPFRHQGAELKKVLVPRADALAYSKLVSFAMRAGDHAQKLAQDLADFVDITNHPDFLLSGLYDRLKRFDPDQQMVLAVRDRLRGFPGLFKQSSLFGLLAMFFEGLGAEAAREYVVKAPTAPVKPIPSPSGLLSSTDERANLFSGVWHHYLATKVDGVRVWRYRVLEFRAGKDVAEIAATLRVPDPRGLGEHVYHITGFTAAPRLILIQRPAHGTESPVVHVYPSATEGFRGSIAGYVFLQTWDAGNAIAPAIMSRSLLSFAKEEAPGTLPHSLYEQLDRHWAIHAENLGSPLWLAADSTPSAL